MLKTQDNTNIPFAAIAEVIAIAAHDGQIDKAGEDYMEHVARVANSFDESDELRTIGFLHDVVEDSNITFADLRQIFPNSIVTSVIFLSRRTGELYFDYIRRVTMDIDAAAVKIADLNDNLSPERSQSLTPSLRKRYERAVQMLESGRSAACDEVIRKATGRHK